MELDHEFTVPVPVDEAWPVLLDLERVAPCIPGATLDSVEGEEFTGRLKVKVGAMTITYKGSGRIVVADPDAHIVTIEGAAKEARGSGTASATVQAQLLEVDEGTKVTVHTKLNVTGRPAQFGRNLLSEVGAKLIARFAAALAEELTHPAEESTSPGEEPAASEPVQEEPVSQAAPAEAPETVMPEAEAPESVTLEAATPEAVASEAEPPAPRHVEPHQVGPRRSEEAIDLLEMAGPSIAKRLLPVAAAFLVAVLAVRYLLRKRSR